jgi:hypothetical protein
MVYNLEFLGKNQESYFFFAIFFYSANNLILSQIFELDDFHLNLDNTLPAVFLSNWMTWFFNFQ